MVVVGFVLLVAVTAFVVQNQDVVSVRFLGWQYQTQVGLVAIGAAVVGALIVYVSALFKHRELRSHIRGVEARLREAEQKPTPIGDEGPRPPHP